MKITIKQLKQIIKEQVEEGWSDKDSSLDNEETELSGVPGQTLWVVATVDGPEEQTISFETDTGELKAENNWNLHKS